MKGSEGKLNSNRNRTDSSNKNTNVNVQNNRDKDQLGQKNAVVYEKGIIYFSKPLANYGDEDEEDSNITEKNLRNRQSRNSQQGQQQSSFRSGKNSSKKQPVKAVFSRYIKGYRQQSH